MGRYCRDEIILQGLEVAHCPTVTANDAPGGVVQPNAWSIKWLQNGLDLFHRMYPFASDITEATMSALVNNEDLVLASDPLLYLPPAFIIDVKNGITGVSQNGTIPFALQRVSYQYFRQAKGNSFTRTARQPSYYSIVNNRIKVAPKVENTLSLVLEYYMLAPTLGPSDMPNFPDEWSLIEFIRLKALEWTRSIDPGTAQLYLQRQLAGFRASGLLHEPEYDDAVPFVSYGSPSTYYNRNAWMGNPNG